MRCAFMVLRAPIAHNEVTFSAMPGKPMQKEISFSDAGRGYNKHGHVTDRLKN